MTIFVLTQARKAVDEWLEVFDTQVFTSIEKARKAMKREADMFMNDPEDHWLCNWGDEPDPVSIHLSSREDEVIWAISEHEI